MPDVSGVPLGAVLPYSGPRESSDEINANHPREQEVAVAAPDAQRFNAPPQKHWCTITYYEHGEQVGDSFKVLSGCLTAAVDDFTDPSCIDRFCLGHLSNVDRHESADKVQMLIGNGVRFERQCEFEVDAGDVWIRVLSDRSVFVQSYHLDREARLEPGDVHKIHSSICRKVFDLRQCYQHMVQQAAASQA